MILAVACGNPKTHATLLFRQVGCQAGRQEEAEIWIKTQQSSFLLSSLFESPACAKCGTFH